MKFRPTLGALLLPSGHPSLTPTAQLSPAQFRDLVRDVSALMEYAHVLEPEELDMLGVTHLNLNAAALVIVRRPSSVRTRRTCSS